MIAAQLPPPSYQKHILTCRTESIEHPSIYRPVLLVVIFVLVQVTTKLFDTYTFENVFIDLYIEVATWYWPDDDIAMQFIVG